MKSLIAMIAIVASANSFAYSVTDSTVLTSLLPSVTTAATSGRAQAFQVMGDAQEYIESGTLAPKLEDQVNILRRADNSLAISEAVDLLMERAQQVLDESN